MAPLRVLMAGGGTGGHLRPALTVAEALKTKAPDTRIAMLVSGRGVEKEFLDSQDLESVPLFPSFASRPSLTRVDAYLRAWHKSRRVRRELKPDVVLLFGGYVSIFAADFRRRTPTILFESNVSMGRAASFLSRFSSHMIVPWEGAAKGARGRCDVRILMMPLESAFFDVDREGAKRELGLDPQRRTLLVLGGSLGAKAINDFIEEAADRWLASNDRLQIFHITGPGKGEAGCPRPHYHRVPFFSRMPLAYGAADLVLSRAGGMTVAEVAASGRGAVLVPYPHHRDHHQRANAEQLEKKGAAIVCEEGPSFSTTMMNVLRELMTDDAKLKEMGNNAQTLSDPSGLDKIVDLVLEKAQGVQR